ncbi:MAG: flavodoxin domain-containing protein [Bacillota bacterium]
MSRVAVVYRSKSGYTEKYAQWIAQAINADLMKGEKTKLEDLLKYDTIVYGGGLYAVGINGVKLITNNLDKLKDKKIIVFGLGASPVRPEIYEEVKNKNFTKEQQEKIEFFLLRGGFDQSKLKPIDRFLMLLMKISLKRKKNLTPDEQGMLNAYSHPVDFTNEKSIEAIVESIQK